MKVKAEKENEIILLGKSLIKNAIEHITKKQFEEAHTYIADAQKLFQSEQSSENVSICLSLMGLCEYFKDKNKYIRALTYTNDAKYLADTSNSTSAKLIYEFVFGCLGFAEEDLETAEIHLQKSLLYAKVQDEFNLSWFVKDHLRLISDKQSAKCRRDPLISLLKIGQTVAAETDVDTLIKIIAQETKTAIQADRCSVFLFDRDCNELWSKVALGMDSQEIRFPADRGLAGHVVQTGETINIKNAYTDKRFNKEIDLQTGYKTNTILCMPIKNLNQTIIGAFQVLNKLEGYFTDEDEDLLVAIGSSAGIALENAQLFKKQHEMLTEQKQVFDSFIDTLAASIDARDKITAGHSSRVRLYSELIANQLELDSKMIEIIGKAATLHDIGKIGIRDSVLQKEGKLTDEEYKHIQEHVEITHKILEKIHMSDDFKLVAEIACSHHEKYNGFGYYRGLKGEEITLGGRILAVSDVFDAITSKRHYRDKMPMQNVISILIKDSDAHFDKSIVDCFLSISTDKIVEVFLTENEFTLESLHKEFLKQYTMLDLYNIYLKGENEELLPNEKAFMKLFDFYYRAKSGQENPG